MDYDWKAKVCKSINKLKRTNKGLRDLSVNKVGVLQWNNSTKSELYDNLFVYIYAQMSYFEVI